MKKILKGIDVIKNFHKTTPSTAGVYRMLNEEGKVLYVGKAKNLSNRIKNYTDFKGVSNRIKRMICETCSMEIIHTLTETDALLLEQDLIKQLNPKYNILLKDDKSYPFLTISKEEIPKLGKFRGNKNSSNNFFGPFPSATALNEGIKLIQHVFGLRTCKTTMMKNRTQPCMLYQIHRCSGICCNKISIENYNSQVKNAISFLKGNNKEVIENLSNNMRKASEEKQYETAIIYRDRITYLNQILKKNNLNNIDEKTDLIAITQKENIFAVEILLLRDSITCGQFSFFPEHTKDATEIEVLESFIETFYTNHEIPKNILTNIEIKNKQDLESILSQINETKVHIETPQKGDKKKAIDNLIKNANLRLERKIIEDNNNKEYLENLQKLFNIPSTITRIDVFDNSHTFGTDKIGAMITVGPKGFKKNDYRKYNIKSKISGDDYKMMFEVLTRRYTRAKKEKTLPSLVIVDGGKGQLDIAYNIIRNMDLEIPVIGIAKGEHRNKPEETLYMKGIPPIKLENNDPMLFFLERIRDEAHRFAITTHRKKREKSHLSSALDDIEGIGQTKKRNLLNYFGSVKNIIDSNIDDLSKVDGINKSLAEKIYKTFH